LGALPRHDSQKMPGHKGPGKFEELLQWDVYQRDAVSATIILI
jgi:hypothetical protein